MTRPLLKASCLALWIALGGWSHTAIAQESTFWGSLADAEGAAWEANLERGLRAHEDGDAELLSVAEHEARLRRPRAPMTLWLSALLAQQEGQHEHALALMDLLPTPPPDALTESTVLRQRAASLFALGRLEWASQALGRIPRSQHTQESLARQGLLRWVQGQPQAALEPLQRAYRMEERPSALTLGALALIYAHTGQRQQARPYLLSLLELVMRDGEEAWPPPRLFWRPSDAALLRALAYEEAGRREEAQAALLEVLKVDSARVPVALRARIMGEGAPTVLAVGPLPMASPSAALADPEGRWLVLGDALGRLWMVDLARRRALHTPSLAGDPVVDLAMRPDGKLVVARQDSYLTLYDLKRGPRAAGLVGPVAMPHGTTPQGLTLDGRALLGNARRSVTWSLGLLERPSQEVGSANLGRTTPVAMDLGPMGEVDAVVPVAVLRPNNQLQVVTLPSQIEPGVGQVPGPPVQAVAFTPDGRHLLAAGRRHLVVMRASDLRVVKILDFGRGAALGDASRVVVDRAGGAGHGPAVLVLHQGRYRAIRLEVVLPHE